MMLPLTSPETCSSQIAPPAADDLAIGDAEIATRQAMDQPAPSGQGDAAAVERDAVKRQAVGAFAR
jgi:hypothetical protein